MPTETIFHRVALVSVAGDCELELEAIQAALMSSMLLEGAKLIILIDEDAGRLEQQEIYWLIINRLDDARRTEGVVVDARGKSGAKQVMQTDVILKTIESRWDEYGL
jgi:UbiD family decarboxylase